MQVKRFEAPTIQEALDTIKRELGPEAIILQTKQNRRGFGLLSKASVEVTAAVSERSMAKKQGLEDRLPEDKKSQVRGMAAEKQAEIFNKYADKQIQQAKATQEKVQFSQPGKRITATRYIDIDENGKDSTKHTNVEKNHAYVNQALSQEMAKEIHRSERSERNERPGRSERAQDSTSSSTSLPSSLSTSTSTSSSSLEKQLQALQQLVEEMKSNQDHNQESKGHLPLFKGEHVNSEENMALEDAFEQLVISGVERRYALAIVRKIKSENESKPGSYSGPNASSSSHWNDTQYTLDCVAEKMMDSLGVLSPLTEILKDRNESSGIPISIALIGATGVGKTTTLAKIASEAVLVRNLKIGLVNLDQQRVGAFDQLATFAKILGVPFRSASTPEDLQAILSDFQGLDLILVDAAGYSQRDSASIQILQESLKMISNLHTYLVLSATTREPELYDTINRFSVLRPKGLVLSKLDEAIVYGSIYNVAQRSKLPLAYFTTGQTVPGDIEEATRERVVSLIMDI